MPSADRGLVQGAGPVPVEDAAHAFGGADDLEVLVDVTPRGARRTWRGSICRSWPGTSLDLAPRRLLDLAHVARPFVLVVAAAGRHGRGRHRRTRPGGVRCDGERRDPVGVVTAEAHATPAPEVVADEVEAFETERVGDAEHVADQLVQRERLDFVEPGARRVAALGEGDGTVAGGGRGPASWWFQHADVCGTPCSRMTGRPSAGPARRAWKVSGPTVMSNRSTVVAGVWSRVQATTARISSRDGSRAARRLVARAACGSGGGRSLELGQPVRATTSGGSSRLTPARPCAPGRGRLRRPVSIASEVEAAGAATRPPVVSTPGGRLRPHLVAEDREVVPRFDPCRATRPRSAGRRRRGRRWR